MLFLVKRARAALRVAFFHFLGSVLVASLAAVLVLRIWYPPPYDLLSGGRNLFLLLVSVDVICGPLLTLVLFNPRKSRRELLGDMALVAALQLAALAYGLYTVHQARPLYLVHEIDRFRVITMADYGEADVSTSIAALDGALRPNWSKGPIVVGIRSPKDSSEQQGVMWESVFGGRDYSQRPDFYLPYDEAYRSKALARVKPLQAFIRKYPATSDAAAALLRKYNIALADAGFLPVVHRQDWVAVLDKSAHILGFLPGDGFEVQK